jgi:ribosomal protein L37E
MILMGYRTRNKVMGQLQYVCPRCQQNSYHAIVRSRRWFTLYFIPLFPLSKTTTARCNLCGFMTAFDNAKADALFAQKQQIPQVPPTAQGPAPMISQPQVPSPKEYPYPIQPQQPSQ